MADRNIADLDVTAIAADLAGSGTLRAAINLGNPVLAQGAPDAPRGVTVDISRDIAVRLGVSVRFVCFQAARDSYQAVVADDADLCFLAVEPAREYEIAFTAAYVVIDGAYAVSRDSPITSVDEVDRPGVRIGVKLGSAYDLFLSRTLEHAQIIRGADGIIAFRDEALDVAAGIRSPLAAAVADDSSLRMLDGSFMQIRQAVGISRMKQPMTVSFLRAVVDELKASGFVAQSLRRSGQASAAVPRVAQG